MNAISNHITDFILEKENKNGEGYPLNNQNTAPSGFVSTHYMSNSGAEYRFRSYYLGDSTPHRALSFGNPVRDALLTRASFSLARRVLDDQTYRVASQAIVDAVGMLSRLKLSRLPDSIVIAEDGFVLTQWRTGSCGLLVVFSGDSVASYSLRRPGMSYSTDTIEFQVNKPPKKLASFLKNA